MLSLRRRGSRGIDDARSRREQERAGADALASKDGDRGGSMTLALGASKSELDLTLSRQTTGIEVDR
jgi:hypothetical protein